MASPLEASHTATERRDPGGEQVEVWHRQSSFILESRLLVDLGVSEGLAIQVELPLRLFHTTIRYEDLAGVEVPILDDDIHHRNETLFGVGDPLIGIRTARRDGPWTMELRAGVRLPLGQTEDDPYTPEALLAPHQHFQFGSGTFDPEISGAVEHDLGELSLGGWLWARPTLYENGRGYEAGDRYATGVFVASPLGTEAWRFSALVEAQVETAERWGGHVPTEDGNQGRFDLYAGLGAQARVGDFWVATSVRTPLYSYIVGGQLELPVVAELAFGGGLALWEEAADKPAKPEVIGAEGADVADTATPEPVPDRVTIVDYWATWCGPCAVLEPRLVALAAANPGLAVRRFDVGEDAPEGMTLPHVVVYDRAGRVVWEGGGSVEDIVSRLEALLPGLLTEP